MTSKIPYIIIVVAVVLVIGVLFKGSFSFTGNIVGAKEVVKIPLSEISGEAEFYEYKGIKYFAIMAEDRSVKTAFDACDVCHDSGKGYRQEGDYMICNNCGNQYPISGLGTENLRGGGCWPGYLPSKIEGDELIIKTSDIEKGRYRFA